MSIGKILIHYEDPFLLKTLKTYKAGRLGPRVRGYDAAHVVPVTLKDLTARNHMCVFDAGGWITKLSETLQDSAPADQILFAKGSRAIRTQAVSCFSYMFHCKALQLGAAVHVSSIHSDQWRTHLSMIRYAYNTLKKLADGKRIVSFISGAYAFHLHGEPESIHRSLVHLYRSILTHTIADLLEHGIPVNVLDVGADSREQSLSLVGGKFEVKSGDRNAL